MRIGVSLGTAAGGGWPPWRDAAVTADRAGLDAILVAASPADDALVLAASLAGATHDIRVAAMVPAGLHPVHLAERVAVTDQVLGGRLIVVLDATPGPDDAAETITVLRAALAARPFRHDGQRWRIPARPPAAAPFRVTPGPAQLSVPLWVTGADADAVAARTGTTWLPGVDERPAARSSPGRADLAAVRPARRLVTRVDAEVIGARETAAALIAERDDWGLDLALLEIGDRRPAEDIRVLARAVRPRTQLAGVPAGLDRFWSATGTDD